MTICYNFASRSRPDKFFAAVDNILENATHDDYFILAVLDWDDKTMFTPQIKKRLDAVGDKVFYFYGKSTSKIHAINREIGNRSLPHWDIVCNHSDDMWWLEKGFDQHILSAFHEFSGLLHIPDQETAAKLCTYSIMDRAYFNRFGYIYHPDFESVYADDHAQLVAKDLGCYQFLDLPLLEHRHFAWGYGEKDALLEKTESPKVYEKDRATFEKLKVHMGRDI